MPEPGLIGSARRDAPAPTSRVDIPLELDEVPDPLVPTPPRDPPDASTRGPSARPARASLLRAIRPPFGVHRSRFDDDARRGPGEPKPKSDPAADAELKRRIERQVREALGDRVRSVEVRVVGRNVAIRAEASRFWQRRSVRRTLESLPGLAGYRTTIDVGD